MPKRISNAQDNGEETETNPNPPASKRTRKICDNEEISDICQKLYDALRSYKSDDDRILCENLIRLPSRRTNPDYYNIIKQPIDFIRIQQKIRTDEYQTLQQFIDDIDLLLTNAKHFYKKNSNEWSDVNDLSKYLTLKLQEYSDDDPSPRRRLSRRNNETETEESIESPRKRRSNRSTEAKPSNGMNGKIEQEETNSLPDPHYFDEFFTAIYNARINDRPISDIFLFLPSKKLYPDYYLVVTQPIDLKLIAEKIHRHEYSSLDELENDFFLMIANAKKYNDPKSQIYKDASALKKLISSVRHEIETAMKTTKPSQDRLRLRKGDVSVSSTVAAMDYPEEPNDADVLRIQEEQRRKQQHDDGAESDTSSFAGEDDSFRTLYNAVKTYKLGTQSLIDPFMKLPNRRFHQDYYEEIQRPIAMSVIKKNIKKGKYLQLSELADDLKLMFNNAMEYNQEGSLIYNSAKKLLDVTIEKAEEFGFDQHKTQLKEARISLSQLPIKDEYLENLPKNYALVLKRPLTSESPSDPPSTNSSRGRPLKQISTFTEENLQTLYKFIREYRENDVSLSEPFLQLPSASEYPDYYETIEHPIDMSMIKEKLDRGSYKDETDLLADFHRMFNNAKLYNEDDSDIFKFASRLERLLLHKHKILNNRKEKFLQKSQTNRSTNAAMKKKASSSKLVQEKIHSLLHAIQNARDAQGRLLSTAFTNLPAKVDYPDYYEIIEHPIDLKRIESRSYSSLDEISKDLQLIFDNACQYNEPGSTIYRDALALQQIFLNKREELTDAQRDVHQVPNLVRNLIWNLFIETFNHQDPDGRYYSDSFSDLPEQADHEPFDLVYTFDLIKQNLEHRRYRRLDVFQEDFFKVFQRARRLSPIDSQISHDTLTLQRFYLRQRDERCGQGNVLQSVALLYTETSLEEELEREREEKVRSENNEEKKSSSFPSPPSVENRSFHLGDFVYVKNDDESEEPLIVCIQSFENEEFFHGLHFLRPREIFHLPTKKFFRQEVFLGPTVQHLPLKKIQGLCHVLHVKDYFKSQAMIKNPLESSVKFEDPEKDVYLCESRYNTKTKIVKPIKRWNVPENDRIELIPRETPMENLRFPLNILDPNWISTPRSSSNQSDSIQFDVIEKVKETVPLHSHLNENSEEKKIFYEQILLASNCFYRIGDDVYINENSKSQSDQTRIILRIEEISSSNDSYLVKGPIFLRHCDKTKVKTRAFHPREVLKIQGAEAEFPVEQIQGKCSILSLKDFSLYRLTEIPECDVYFCQSESNPDDPRDRSLTKDLQKKFFLSSKCVSDEIWTFSEELHLGQEISAGQQFKVIDDGSFMDVDDQTNSNHASTIDPDEHSSNHLNFDAANSSTSNNNHSSTNPNPVHSTSTTPTRTNQSRRNNRRGSSARAPCGYLVFASESRKRLIKDNPGIPFGEMSRMIGDQWRRLTASERDKFEEKARERAREQEISQVTSTATSTSSTTTTPTHSVTSSATTTPQPIANPNASNNFESQHSMPILNPQRLVNGGVTINGHYQVTPNLSNVHQINGNLTTIAKPPAAAIVTGPPRTQRLVHSEAYLRYIENLKPDHQFISDWPKQLKASMNNGIQTANGNQTSRTLPSNWFSNNSPGLYNSVYEALWSMRDNMWSDVVRIRNVLSEEW